MLRDWGSGIGADCAWILGLRHVLEELARAPVKALRRRRPEMFWALKDVSLEVRDGEVLGLIGPEDEYTIRRPIASISNEFLFSREHF